MFDWKSHCQSSSKTKDRYEFINNVGTGYIFNSPVLPSFIKIVAMATSNY